jgi:hypothetical protein
MEGRLKQPARLILLVDHMRQAELERQRAVPPQSPDEFNLRNLSIAVFVNLPEHFRVIFDRALLDVGPPSDS